MNSKQNITGLKNPRELGGVLVYDALMPRAGIVGSNPNQTDAAHICAPRMTEVGK